MKAHGLTRAEEVRWLIRTGASYNDAVRMLHNGQLTQRAFDWFCFFWDWCAPRFSGSAAFKQDRFYRRRGGDALQRRYARVKRWHDQIKIGAL